MEELKAWLNDGRGRVVELATACRITHSAVSQWDRVPSERLLVVERVTGIPRARLRPDLFAGMEAAQ